MNVFPLGCPVIQAAGGRKEEKTLDVSEGLIISDTDEREAPVFSRVLLVFPLFEYKPEKHNMWM